MSCIQDHSKDAPSFLCLSDKLPSICLPSLLGGSYGHAPADIHQVRGLLSPTVRSPTLTLPSSTVAYEGGGLPSLPCCTLFSLVSSSPSCLHHFWCFLQPLSTSPGSLLLLPPCGFVLGSSILPLPSRDTTQQAKMSGRSSFVVLGGDPGVCYSLGMLWGHTMLQAGRTFILQCDPSL